MGRTILIQSILAAALLCSCAPIQEKAEIRLVRNGESAQLYLNGSPFIILGGELANSSASSSRYMDGRDSWRKLKDAGLNTVLAPVYWEMIEPEEGKFDFSSAEYLISSARENDLHLILLWFGTWKNSMSCYVPSWMKKEFGGRFTLAVDGNGDTPEILSAFDTASMEADKKAFSALMEFLKEKDGSTGTVLMVQVENEIGMLGSAREHGQKAEALWKEEYPDGGSIMDEERFQARYYARYAGEVAAAGKEKYDIPMYVNAALNSRGRKPGEYPSAGPLDHLMDIWKAEAPAIDIISPDIYDPGFTDWTARYSRDDNPLFIPEIRQEKDNATRVFYALGAHSALGFSPFSIDNGTEAIEKSYRLLEGFLPQIAKAQEEGRVHGVLCDRDNPETVLTAGEVTFTIRHDGTISWSPVAGDPDNWGEGAFLIIEEGEGEFLFLGTGCVATMSPSDGKGHIGILSIEELSAEGSVLRRLNGDEDHQGRHLRIPYGEVGAQRLKIYRY